MYQLDMGGFTVDVVRKDIKNIHLSVYPPEGRVRIAAPLDVEDENIKLFIISKISWIKKNQRKFKNQDRQPKRAFLERESHYFEGRRYLLKVVEHNAPPRVVIRNKTYMDIYVRPGATQEQCKKILNEWYRKQLKSRIPEIIEKWEKITGVNILDWSVKLMKTKWGTCNVEKKSILINLELAKKPLSCLEYIIVHEMIHLLERHHNERFLYYLNQFMPRWKSLKEELNQFPISHGDWSY